jgi:hypothetical protein
MGIPSEGRPAVPLREGNAWMTGVVAAAGYHRRVSAQCERERGLQSLAI